MTKLIDPKLNLLLDDVERVLGNLILELGVEGEEREVWHQLQAYLGMDIASDDEQGG